MRALISVSDKTGVVDLARRLVALGHQIVSSGGTAAAIADAGVAVTKVTDVTGAPEMLDGRVKTLHPAIHGGILADLDRESHRRDLAEREIEPIGLVVANLYPFSSDPSVELIDIGGPAMVRAAAKNHAHVGIVVNPADYEVVVAELEADSGLSEATRRRLARAAFAHTAAYDAAIVEWFDATDGETLPETVHPVYERTAVLRYGENPHQPGARYRRRGTKTWWDTAAQHNGKEMSYLNVADTEAAYSMVTEHDDPTVVVVKHANPCGVASHDDIAEAYRRANACDPVSAFGGIVALNRPLTAEVATDLAEVFTEVVVAPSYEDGALEILCAKKNLRVIEAPDRPRLRKGDLLVRSIDGGALLQGPDFVTTDPTAWTVATRRAPTDTEWVDLVFAWRVVARVSSNSIVVVRDRQAFGIGAGQQNRRDAGRIAAAKADGRAAGGACASDAFFPFRDGLDAAAEAGCTAVVQPGGSVRDDEVIAAADEHGMTMVFTGERHFRH
ncbi:MAG: bifunctional phosphoribosylaminoimidazolecarboxamide formyltransferase/IMP cyclohydrolase [Acidimicrobiales bacterium]